jgi:PKD repeat protein
MILKKVLFFFAFTTIFISCSKSDSTTSTTTPTTTPVVIVTPPTASFTYTFSGGNTMAPANVIFTNTSKNATSYSWNFGDFTSSLISDPSNVYNNQGVYTVTLKATGQNALSSSISQTITVGPKATKCQLDSITIQNITTQPNYSSNNTFVGKIIISRVSDNAKLLTTSSYTFGIIPTNSYAITNTPYLYQFTNLIDVYKIEFIQAASVSPLQLLDKSLGYISITPSLLMVGQYAYPTKIPLEINGTKMTLKLKWL